MEKVKKVLHIRSKSRPETDNTLHDPETRQSIDEELAAMSPAEREKYLKEFEEAEKTGAPKKGSFLEKLIERGNKRTEDQLQQEAKERNDGVVH
ncbi:hypothetical protein CC78DRAFT_581478 [Lojkania enalia]|uniref:Uncharacterized protein n=1 Tax=Lojkania enalia TaxID=147567 RepID=A0A9P4KC64_9PLEO|nr:hypothetical protein CC78DRAFT_581478 [Didymosphaeria enalia]